MKEYRNWMGAGLVSAMLLAATPAQAQPQMQDLDPEAVAAAARYALPMAFEGYLQACTAGLDKRGYAISNTPALRAKFSEGSDEAWPAARAALLQMASGEAGEMSSILAGLGDAELRPFVDGMVKNLVAEQLRSQDCGDIERGLEILDPLPADNMAQMVGFFFEIGAREEAKEEAAAAARAKTAP
jgi:hypothetical protein